jgi:uncharacterized protein YggT (Ycf19 family)
MSSMLPMPRNDQGTGTSSQVALEVILNLYAAFVVLFAMRTVLLVAQVDPRVWVGRTIYRFTDPLVAPLGVLPGAGQSVIGAVTLADLTAMAVVLLIPLGIALRRGGAEIPSRP